MRINLPLGGPSTTRKNPENSEKGEHHTRFPFSEHFMSSSTPAGRSNDTSNDTKNVASSSDPQILSQESHVVEKGSQDALLGSTPADAPTGTDLNGDVRAGK